MKTSGQMLRNEMREVERDLAAPPLVEARGDKKLIALRDIEQAAWEYFAEPGISPAEGSKRKVAYEKAVADVDEYLTAKRAAEKAASAATSAAKKNAKIAAGVGAPSPVKAAKVPRISTPTDRAITPTRSKAAAPTGENVLLITTPVFGAAYMKDGTETLTHAVLYDRAGEWPASLCRKVKNVMDDESQWTHDPPTCAACLPKWKRLKTEHPELMKWKEEK